MRIGLVMTVVVLSACGTTRCLEGSTQRCQCSNNAIGVQTCQADGSLDACDCSSAACNASNCSGCCDETGTCTTSSVRTCGKNANACVACAADQLCRDGQCEAATECQRTCSGCCTPEGACLELSFETCGLQGATCQRCVERDVCQAAGCTRPKLIFATSVGYAGDFGGLAAGDEKCMLAAQSAGLSGTFKAWLSDGTTSAGDRIADVGPWSDYERGVDWWNARRTIVSRLKPFSGNGVVSFDEHGVRLTRNVWTGTSNTGATTTTHCNGWTSTTGTGTHTGGFKFSDEGARDCTNQNAIICFEQ